MDDAPVISYFKNLAPHLAKDSQIVAVFFAVGDGSFLDRLADATPEFLANLDICFDNPSVERCLELNRKGLELAGCISPETSYPFQKRYLPVIDEGYRRFNAIQKDLQSKPQRAVQKFGENEGERGVRVSSEEFAGTLGDGFAVGVNQKDLERFCAALQAIKLLPPSPSMAKVAEQLLAELTAPEVAGVNVMAGTRLLIIRRTVDHSGSLPKVTGCDETRILTILGAIASSQPALIETYIKMMRTSGIPVKFKPLSKEIVRFEVFDESLEIGIGRAN